LAADEAKKKHHRNDDQPMQHELARTNTFAINPSATAAMAS
jgi:hypothetical protein